MLGDAVLSVVLAAGPIYQPPPAVIADEYTTPDGHRVRWASVAYTLPDGQLAEVVLTADGTSSGDGYLFVDGEAVVHTSYDDVNGVVSWISSDPEAHALAAAALVGLTDGAADELLKAFTEGPQEFPCSQWGKKVLRAGKYIWGGLVAGGAAACCTASSGAGCILCAGAGWMVAEAGADALDGYCD